MRHILFFLPVAMLLAACTQDELTDRTGEALPEPIPLELTAGMGEATATPATRGTYDGDWDGVTSVKVIVFSKEMEYMVTALSDNKTASLSPAVPLSRADIAYWWTHTMEKKNFRAWTPTAYALDTEFNLPATWGKDDFTTCDILGAGKIITYEERNDPVAFSHLLAKVVINIQPSDYLETYSNSVSVQICDLYNTGKFVDYTDDYLTKAGLEITGAGDKTTVTPYRTQSFGTTTPATYEALVIPQTIDSGSKLKITVGSATTYEWEIDITEFVGGYEYTFDITVREQGLEVSAGSSIDWGEGSSGSGSVTLPIEIDLSQTTDAITIDDDKAYLLTGSGSKPVKISGDATVILQGVNLTTTSGNAISVESGNPTIHVKGTNNSVTGYNAGIYVAENSTLTITGDSRDDMLTATGNNGGSGIGGYVLNSRPYTSFPYGNILITNVTVNAWGSVDGVGSNAPGIGNAGSTTGTIIIDYATVHAYGCEQGHTIGRVSTPGIGCGKYWLEEVPSSVPTVTIRNQSEVHAHRGNISSLRTDYIGWLFGDDYPTDANSAIRCGEGGGVYDSTVCCYTGDTLDKIVVYDESGNEL